MKRLLNLLLGMVGFRGPLGKLGAEIHRNADGQVVSVRFSFFKKKVTDAGLVHLKEMTNLESLELNECPQVADAGLVHLKGFTNLQTLSIEGTQVTDAGLVHLKDLTNLQSLSLANTQVTDAAPVHLKGMANLQYLSLANTQVTDAGLLHLKGMASLWDLSLGYTQVTDAGLAHLKEIASLEFLELDGTQVTDTGIADLGKALPSCEICANWLAGEADKPDEDRPFCANCRAHTRHTGTRGGVLKCQTCKGNMQTPSDQAAGPGSCLTGFLGFFMWTLLGVLPALILGSILGMELLLSTVALCGLPIATLGLPWYVGHHTRQFRRRWMEYVNDYEDRHHP